MILGKGQNYKNRNIENQKEHRKNSKPSEHRKCPSIFHKSDQNVKNQKYQLPMRITYGYQSLWGVRLGSVRLG